MPANRSRTQEWRRCLKQIADRNGTIELAIARDYAEKDRFPDLLWRVRLLHLDASEMIVELPGTMGQSVDIKQGVDLIAILSVGQNRWMFHTTKLGDVDHKINAQKSILGMRLLMPDAVQRCQRRDYYRIDTAAINLPEVAMWPLLDPASVVLAERANEIGIDQTPASCGDTCATAAPLDTMPEVGPEFQVTLLNIGGGGVGVLVKPRDASSLHSAKYFWLRISLPELDGPICATGKLVHTHIESSQSTYGGLAFDFSFNPAHQQFVVDQICRYIAHQQRLQLQRQSTLELRKSA